MSEPHDHSYSQNGEEFAGKSLSEVMREVEKQYLCALINECEGNKAEAARRAGLTYPTFVRKFKALNLKVVYCAA